MQQLPTLRQFAELLDDNALTVRTTALIEREEGRLRWALAPWRERLGGKRALLYTGGVKSWSVVAALQDLGVELVITGTKKSTEEDKARIKELMGADARLLEDGNLRLLLDCVRDHPVVIPDISDSLDGHLTASDFSPVTTGGTPVAAFAALGDAAATLAIGASLYPAAELLQQRTGVPTHCFEHLLGLEATDALALTLAGISGRAPPPPLERQRAQLQDTMLDTHFLLGQARCAVAADPDTLHAFCCLLAEMGAEVVAAVAS